jgi:hypothetical protein
LKLRWRRIFVYFLPLALNVALIAYLVWQLGYAPGFERHTRLQMFAVLYGMGGVVVAVSGVTAFLHATTREKAARGYFALALINTIVPTLVLLVMLRSSG